MIDELDRSSDRVLELIGDPKRDGAWDSARDGGRSRPVREDAALHGRGGEGFGDVGYKVVVILSGIHENLRQQTQERIEECITGKNSREDFAPFGIRNFSRKYRVHPVPALLPDITSLTSVAGDYGAAVNRIVDVALGEVPVIFVIKKNVSILKNLLKQAPRTQCTLFTPPLAHLGN